MAENDDPTRRRWPAPLAWWTGAIATGFLFAVLLGFLAAHQRHAADGWSRTGLIVLAVLVGAQAIGVAGLIRWRHVLAGSGAPKAASERANQRLLAWSGVVGGMIGLALALIAFRSRADGASASILVGALPAWFAVTMALVWGVALPLLSWRWHRVIDEHERDAYRDGAVAGYYVMAIGAPIWWFLWRGGLAPAVDAFWLFNAVILASGVVWLWRKYA